MQNNESTRLVTWLAGVMALLVVCLPPLSYGIFSYQYLQGSVTSEAEINSRIISNLINDNPLLWHHEEMRLEEILAQRSDSGENESRRIVDLQGRLIAASDSPLPPPLFKKTHEVMDAGQVVARLEIVRSLQPLLLKTGVAALVGLFLGLAVFVSLRILPIRALKKAEKERNRLARLVDAAPAVIIVHDTKGNILYANQTTFDLHGYPREEFMALNLHELDEPVSAKMIESRIRQIKDQGRASFDVSHSRKDGSLLPMHVSVRTAEWDDEIVYESISVDITAHKKAEEALKESEYFFKESQRSASIGSYKADLTGDHWESSEVLDSIFGIGPEYDRTIQGWQDLIHPEDRQMMELHLKEEVAGQGNPFAKEYRIIRHNDGEIRWVSGLGTIKADSKDKSVILMGTIQDVTELKRKEEEKAQLEHQLQQAQKIESIGQLAGGVAHDFNNMLCVILGYTELALMKADPTSQIITDLQDIQTAANRSADLTRQLLTFARKQIISPIVLDLNETVAGMLKMLQRMIGENIYLSWNPASSLWPVKMDPSQLDQILANLCVNARDAIGGVGKITIETQNTSINESDLKYHPQALPGEYVRLSVADDGHGIDKEILPQIFEPFFTTKEFGQGTGLGLSTVFGAVKQNHGFIEVDSKLGQGTTLHIYLPRKKATEAAVTEATAKPFRQGTETILLVEDDKMLLKLMQTMLQQSGYTVLVASTIDLALSLAKEYEGPIQLLLSDMIMPEMNGRDLRDTLQVIRPEMKVIFMSGYTADIIAKQGVVEEGVHFLQKPVSFEVLTTKVREVLDSTS